MAYEKFFPVVWSTNLNRIYKKSLVYGNLVNSDYQGDVKYGSTVKMNTLGKVTIGKYTEKDGVGDPEELDAEQMELKIDQRDFFNFKVEDIAAAQSNINILTEAMTEAAFGIAENVDKFIANLYTGVDENNIIGTDAEPQGVHSGSLYNHLVDLDVKLSEANVPKKDRFVVIPEAGYGMLQKDARFTKFPEVLYDGYIGNVSSLKVYTSNNCPVVGGNYKIMAGHRSAITFASQLNKVESFRQEKHFADAVKGLNVYGAKLAKPKGIAVLTAKFDNY